MCIRDSDIVIKVWDASIDYEHSSDPNYIQGNGTYGQILTVVDVLDAYVYGCTDPEALNFNEYANMDDGSCDYTIEQSIDLLSYQLNNISFNVNLWNSYDFEDALSSVDVLLAYNDMDEYYVPEFGIMLNPPSSTDKSNPLSSICSSADQEIG